MPRGVYVHFPWCLTKCPYCDFLSVAVPSPTPGRPASAKEARAGLPHEPYANAVVRELDARLPRLAQPAGGQADSKNLKTIFFGGGTPSLWDPACVGRVIGAIRDRFGAAQDLEVTVECNPTSIDADHLTALFNAGVTRISLGVQGLDTERLAFLGRLHDPGGALQALRVARASRIAQISADLIFGVHAQRPEQAVAEVDAVAELGVTHFSAYALTIEPGTRFGALHRAGRLPLLDDQLVAESFEAVSARAGQLGFEHYEVSNFCKPQGASQHNLGYWLGHDYLGLGCGAWGTVGLAGDSPGSRLRYRNLLSPERYMDTYATDPDFDPFCDHVSDRERISAQTSISEAVMLGLRLARGISPSELESRFPAHFFTDARRRSVDHLLEQSRLSWRDDRLTIPRQHWLFADAIIRELI